jgi:hypothetical protein
MMATFVIIPCPQLGRNSEDNKKSICKGLKKSQVKKVLFFAMSVPKNQYRFEWKPIRKQ